MNTKTAWGALFSKAPSKGMDLDAAAQVLDGVDQIDPSDAAGLSNEVIDRAEEFLLDPADFIAQNADDPRAGKWQQLAGATSPPTSAPAPSRPAAPPPPAATPVPATLLPLPSAVAPGLSVSTLRRAKVGSTTPTLGGLSLSRRDVGGEVILGDKGSTSVAEETPTPDIPPVDSTPGLVRAFQFIQDQGRVDGELVRERTAATRRETPAAQKRRLDAEAAERRRRLDEDAAERQRRMAEEEEALRRRLAIQAEADEKKRLAELRLAAEKQRLDEEAEVRMEERKRAREEARERKPPEPPLDRNLPPLGMTVIQSPKYIELRDRLMTAVQSERRGETGAEDEVRKLGREITRLAGSRNRLEELAGGMLHQMRRSLAEWQDVHDPKAFQASYITGIYAD